MKYYVGYRKEFGAYIDAKDEDEAIEKFKKGSVEVVGELWDEYFDVEE